MLATFRNPEFRKIVVKLSAIQLAFAVIFISFLGYEFLGLNKSLANQNIALVGKILQQHPELENEITGLITKGATQVEITKGRQLLAQYGYEEDITVNSQPVLNNFITGFELKSSILILLYFIPLFFLIKIGHDFMYSRINKISLASERVIDGDFSITLPEEGEGDFGILGHRFNQMASQLRQSLKTLQKYKNFLKDIISDISHQLKTPLSSLITFNELLLNDDKMKQETRVNFLEKSRSQFERMEWLIINLLKIARLEAGAIIFKKEHIPLALPLETAVHTLNNRLREKRQYY